MCIWFQDLFLPSSLDSANATAIALAYAVKSKEVSEAEALIAEHRYQQMLIQSRSYLLHMKKTRAKADKIARDQRRFHSLIHNRISVIDIGSKRRQYSTKGRLRSRGETFLWATDLVIMLILQNFAADGDL